MAPEELGQEDPWVPDRRTLEWAADRVSAESLAEAIAHDVPLRVGLPPGVPEEAWFAAGDAAYEATWWPIMRAAEGLYERGDAG
jgi:hypothetical protein